jgi:GTP-binding protein
MITDVKKFNADLAKKVRWLVLNKVDQLSPDEADKRCKDIVRRLRWKGPVLRISGLARVGTDELCQTLMTRIEQIDADATAAAEA